MNINYRQLVFAREYRGYTQTELSSHIKGLSQSNLSKYEKGIGVLSDDIICRIASFLNFPLPFFEIKILNKIENAHYRKGTGVLKSERSQIEYSNKLIGYLIDQMSESIEFPEFFIKMIDVAEGFSPEYIAEYTRRFFGLKEDPICDIISLLEKNGIIVVELDANVEHFDGVSFFTDGGYPVIAINRAFSNDRKRFTIAHELGHIIMHSSVHFLISEYRDKEKEANTFASEFLMPSNVMRHTLRNMKLAHLGDLKKYWLTSMASILRRAKDLGCITNEQYKYFVIEFSRKGYRKEEPVGVPIDTPTVFYTAYKMHKQELNYTDNELANAFSLPLDVITRFFNNSNNLKLRVTKNSRIN